MATENNHGVTTMNKAYILALLGGCALALGIYANIDTIIRSTQQGLSPIANAINPTLRQVVASWNNLPEVYRGLMIAGIPTLFTLFFAWSKSRAMQKLQQTQLETQQKISGMNDQLLSSRITNTQLQKQVQAYQNMPQSVDLSSTVSSLQQDKLTLQQENQRLINEMNSMERTYQAIIQDLKLQQVTVVK